MSLVVMNTASLYIMPTIRGCINTTWSAWCFNTALASYLAGHAAFMHHDDKSLCVGYIKCLFISSLALPFVKYNLFHISNIDIQAPWHFCNYPSTKGLNPYYLSAMRMDGLSWLHIDNMKNIISRSRPNKKKLCAIIFWFVGRYIYSLINI